MSGERSDCEGKMAQHWEGVIRIYCWSPSSIACLFRTFPIWATTLLASTWVPVLGVMLVHFCHLLSCYGTRLVHLCMVEGLCPARLLTLPLFASAIFNSVRHFAIRSFKIGLWHSSGHSYSWIPSLDMTAAARMCWVSNYRSSPDYYHQRTTV